MPRRPWLVTLTVAALLALAAPPPACAADPVKVRVGYWASGASAGIGFVLEERKFLEDAGLKPQWVRFTKLAEVNRALISKSIDIAVAGGTLPTLQLAAEGVPARAVLANLIAEAHFVVPEASPIRAVAGLKGKKIGSTPPGSTAHALVATILETGHGFRPDEYKQIPAGEAQIPLLMSRGEMDAALLRSITLAAIGQKARLRVIGNVPDEWKKLIKADAPPFLGLAVVHDDWSRAHPEALVRYVAANLRATRWGAANRGEVAAILKKHLQMDDEQATAYAGAWNQIYVASLEEADMASVMRMVEIFKAAGQLPGTVTREKIFLPEPYRKARELVK